MIRKIVLAVAASLAAVPAVLAEEPASPRGVEMTVFALAREARWDTGSCGIDAARAQALAAAPDVAGIASAFGAARGRVVVRDAAIAEPDGAFGLEALVKVGAERFHIALRGQLREGGAGAGLLLETAGKRAAIRVPAQEFADGAAWYAGPASKRGECVVVRLLARDHVDPELARLLESAHKLMAKTDAPPPPAGTPAPAPKIDEIDDIRALQPDGSIVRNGRVPPTPRSSGGGMVGFGQPLAPGTVTTVVLREQDGSTRYARLAATEVTNPDIVLGLLDTALGSHPAPKDKERPPVFMVTKVTVGPPEIRVIQREYVGPLSGVPF